MATLSITRDAGWPYQNTHAVNVTRMAAVTQLIAPESGSVGAVRAATRGGEQGQDEGTIVLDVLKDHTRLVFVTELLSNRQSSWGDPLLALRSRLAGLPVWYDTMITETREHWEEFWGRSSVWIETRDTTLNAALLDVWYGGQYLLAMASRGGEAALHPNTNGILPPGLYGPWITSDLMGWGSDFHLNYNLQAPYYGTFGSNHAELAAAFYGPILAWMPEAARIARRDFGCSGVHFGGTVGPWGSTGTDVGDMGQRSDGLFTALVAAHHWRHTRNVSFFQESFGTVGSEAPYEAGATPYLLMRDVVEFWRCYLQRNDTTPNQPWLPRSIASAFLSCHSSNETLLARSRYQYDSWNDCHDELCSGNQYAITKNNKPTNAMLRFLLPTLLDAAAALQVCRTAPSPSRFLVQN